MFHVEQFGFGTLFHVERKHAKTLLNSGVLACLFEWKNNFCSLSERFFIEKISSFHPNFSRCECFSIFIEKICGFTIILLFCNVTVVLTEKTCVIARFFLLFSPVFLTKAKVYCSDFFVFAIIIIVFWCFQAFLWVFFAKYSDYCTRFLVCADAFLHIYRAFSFYLCNCLPFVRVYCADDVYVLIFTLCRSQFCIRSGVCGSNILFLSTCRCFQDFDALREGRIFAFDAWRFFWYPSFIGFVMLAFP